jgi:hypothetical protein
MSTRFCEASLNFGEILLIVVAFLFPLAVYCLVLGMLNRRQHPLMVSAAWDFAGLLFAASGFLVFGFPGMLSSLSEHGRHIAMFGVPPQDDNRWNVLRDLFEGLASTLYAFGNGAILLAYFLIVVVGCACVIWRRQSQTAVYNIHPHIFDEILGGVLDATGFVWARAGERWFIRRPDKARQSAAEAITVEKPLETVQRPVTAEDLERSAYLEVDATASLCHVTMRWETQDEDLRKQVEGELANALSDVRTRDNPASTWLLSAGSVMLCATIMIFVFAILYRMYGR